MNLDWTIDPALGAQEGFVDYAGGRTWYAIVGDEATPVQVAAIAERIPQAEWAIFEESAHLAHAEESERYMAVLADFLARAEA